MTRLSHPLLALLLGCPLLALPACNTTEGFGKDLERAGAELSAKSREVGYQESDEHHPDEYREEIRVEDPYRMEEVPPDRQIDVDMR